MDVPYYQLYHHWYGGGDGGGQPFNAQAILNLSLVRSPSFLANLAKPVTFFDEIDSISAAGPAGNAAIGVGNVRRQLCQISLQTQCIFYHKDTKKEEKTIHGLMTDLIRKIRRILQNQNVFG